MRYYPGRYKRPRLTPKDRRQITVRLPPDLIEYAEYEAYMRTARPPYEIVTLSDVIRIALLHLKDTAAAGIPKDRKPCNKVVTGDQVFCTSCGLSWSTEISDLLECPKTKETLAHDK